MAFVMGTLFLTAVATVVIGATCVTVFLYAHLDMTSRFWWSHFADHWTAKNAAWVAGKTAAAAAGSAVIVYHCGTTPKRSSGDIGRSVHSTLLRALLSVLTVHAVFAFFEF